MFVLSQEFAIGGNQFMMTVHTCAVDLDEWEDVEVKAAPDEVKSESKGASALADEDEWEDV